MKIEKIKTGGFFLILVLLLQTLELLAGSNDIVHQFLLIR